MPRRSHFVRLVGWVKFYPLTRFFGVCTQRSTSPRRSLRFSLNRGARQARQAKPADAATPSQAIWAHSGFADAPVTMDTCANKNLTSVMQCNTLSRWAVFVRVEKLTPETVESASAEWIVRTAQKHGGSLTLGEFRAMKERPARVTKMNYGKRFAGSGEGAVQSVKPVLFGTPAGAAKQAQARKKAAARREKEAKEKLEPLEATPPERLPKWMSDKTLLPKKPPGKG